MTYELSAHRIAELASGTPQPPVRIEIHPTDRCNLKCGFCWQVATSDQDYSWEFPDVKWLSIIDGAAGLGVWERIDALLGLNEGEFSC